MVLGIRLLVLCAKWINVGMALWDKFELAKIHFVKMFFHHQKISGKFFLGRTRFPEKCLHLQVWNPENIFSPARDFQK